MPDHFHQWNTQRTQRNSPSRRPRRSRRPGALPPTLAPLHPKAGASAGYGRGQAGEGRAGVTAGVTAGAHPPAAHATPLTICWHAGAAICSESLAAPGEREEAAQRDTQSSELERHSRVSPPGGRARTPQGSPHPSPRKPTPAAGLFPPATERLEDLRQSLPFLAFQGCCHPLIFRALVAGEMAFVADGNTEAHWLLTDCTGPFEFRESLRLLVPTDRVESNMAIDVAHRRAPLASKDQGFIRVCAT